MISVYKSVIAAMLLLTCSISFAAQQYVTVQCNMNPATDYQAKISDPMTGKMLTMESCGVALANVPLSHKLVSVKSAGSSGASFINYLFALNPQK